MSKKFETDDDDERLEDLAYIANKDRKIAKEHEIGPGTMEPKLYEPDENGKCQCLFCKSHRRNNKK